MKLRSKTTGKIYEIPLIQIPNLPFGGNFSSLSSLNEEWEDYEPKDKDFWFFDEEGIIRDTKEENWPEESVAAAKEIGDHFSSREEAERAVEKLKALTKLCKKGFEFNSVEMFSMGLIRIEASIPINEKTTLQERSDITDSLYLLFGGEE